MNAPQKRQRPELAGTGREVEQQIKFASELYGATSADTTAARAGYRGITPPRTAPTSRDSFAISTDLLGATGRLGAIAGQMSMFGPTWELLAEADRLLTGCGRLVVELRQRVLP